VIHGIASAPTESLMYCHSLDNLSKYIWFINWTK